MRTNVIENSLIKIGISIFSVREFANILKINHNSAKYFLIRNSKKDGSHIVRIKRGLYLFSLNPVNELEIANKLYQPSYISFETALSHYNVIPETVYSVTSATTKRSKEFTAQNKVFRYYKIKKNLYFGYRLTKFNNKVVLMADAEKALLDYVYLLSLKKGTFNERLDLSMIDTKKLGNYVNHFKKAIKKNKAFISLISEIYKSL